MTELFLYPMRNADIQKQPSLQKKKPSSSIRMSTVTFWTPIDYSLLSFTLQMSSRSQIYTKHSQESFYFINTLKLCTQCRWSGCLENLPQMSGLYLGKWWRELPSPAWDYTHLSSLILKFQISKRTLIKLFFTKISYFKLAVFSTTEPI